MTNINHFGALAGLVKQVKRTGWLRYLPAEKVQSVGDHSAKIAFLSLSLRNIQGIDHLKCLQMSLIHDIAEGITGDFTPYCKITSQQKFEKQNAAIQVIFKELGQQNLIYYKSIWLQYQKGETYEAKIVKDLDKLEMMQQAFQYQKHNNINLTQFYDCIKNMKTVIIRTWAQQLLQERIQYLAKQKSAKQQ